MGEDEGRAQSEAHLNVNDVDGKIPISESERDAMNILTVISVMVTFFVVAICGMYWHHSLKKKRVHEGYMAEIVEGQSRSTIVSKTSCHTVTSSASNCPGMPRLEVPAYSHMYSSSSSNGDLPSMNGMNISNTIESKETPEHSEVPAKTLEEEEEVDVEYMEDVSTEKGATPGERDYSVWNHDGFGKFGFDFRDELTVRTKMLAVDGSTTTTMMEDQEEMEGVDGMIDEVLHLKQANEIQPEEIMKEDMIGQGHFGCVYKARWQGNVVVVKELHSESMTSATKMKEMKAEIVLASSIASHQNLVEIYGFRRNPFGVVMGYMGGDSVEKYVYRKHKKSIPEIMELLIILKKAASGFKFLHHHGLVHRDIAARNILLGTLRNGAVDRDTQVRVADFGLTRKMEQRETAQQTMCSLGPLKWMAPESILNRMYSKKSDVYMFGVTMWEIFYGMEPYSEMKDKVQLAHAVCYKHRRPIEPDPNKHDFHEMPDVLEQLMETCWSPEPSKRPCFKTIIDALNLVETNPGSRRP